MLLLFTAALLILALVATAALERRRTAAIWHHLRQIVSSAGLRGGTHAAAAALSLGSVAQPAAAQALPVPPTRLGANLTGVVWYQNERAFANLMLGGYWQVASPTTGWRDLDSSLQGPDGELKAIPPGDGDVVRMLMRPDTGPKGAIIRCTYQGRGEIAVHGAATEAESRKGEIRFRWINRWDQNNVWLQIHKVDPAAPIANMDCRETTMPAEARFDPAFVAGLKGYKVLRFMDWMWTNGNDPIRWSTRHTPTTVNITRNDGVPVEDIIALAKAVGTDAWVNMPWNADDDYVEHFARAVHDGMPPERRVYIELSNEVWNLGFLAARQSAQEGLQRGLSTNPQQAQLLRYAQRAVEVMRIWERVFADRPKSLVRVVATQQVNPRTAEIVMGAPGIAQHVDALATAPYFGLELMQEGRTSDLDEIFRRMNLLVDKAIANALDNKAVAARYGKRYIAYEAGQHVVMPYDVPLSARIQRDPRMYDLYKRYLEDWRKQVGDTIALFATTGAISPFGAFGLAEHSGQSPADAPKLRAALEARDR